MDEKTPTDECEHSALICACGKNHPIVDDPAARYRKRLEFRAPAVLEQLERMTGNKRMA